MMKFQKRFVPLLLALVLALGTLPAQAAALTRGEAAQALVMLTRAFGGFAVPVGDNAIPTAALRSTAR